MFVWQVFDARYNGYSTDELFFVRVTTFIVLLKQNKINHTLIQFNHEWGGRPWDAEAKDFLQK